MCIRDRYMGKLKYKMATASEVKAKQGNSNIFFTKDQSYRPTTPTRHNDVFHQKTFGSNVFGGNAAPAPASIDTNNYNSNVDNRPKTAERVRVNPTYQSSINQVIYNLDREPVQKDRRSDTRVLAEHEYNSSTANQKMVSAHEMKMKQLTSKIPFMKDPAKSVDPSKISAGGLSPESKIPSSAKWSDPPVDKRNAGNTVAPQSIDGTYGFQRKQIEQRSNVFPSLTEHSRERNIQQSGHRASNTAYSGSQREKTTQGVSFW
eukprot:TRINITY_DN6577_c0_g1_i4.p1 TRINITY_DN6577_c0_g1~~TRINITY_DN6577_c0_g1_i4.p1  ORF type:complete len:261 (+),score=37.46 TRINITY_DN6577_c0_g1_i4:65-847(+)